MSQLEMNFMPIATDARARDQQDLMSFPCFSLSKNKRTDTIRFEDSKGNFVEVSPHQKYGMATVWDFDIMLYFVSYIRHLIDKGESVPSTFTVSGYDILKFCGRSTGKSQYDQLRKGLLRLSSTFIQTNIREDMIADEEVERKETYLNFSWVSAFKENTVTRTNTRTGKKKEVSRSIEVQLPQWFVDGVANSRLVLGINPNYFQLTSGIERFLYRTARKFSGVNPNGVSYTLRHIFDRSGSNAEYREFKRSVKQAIERGNIPDYHFGLYKKGGKDWLFFTKKDEPDAHHEPMTLQEALQDFELIAETPRQDEETT